MLLLFLSLVGWMLPGIIHEYVRKTIAVVVHPPRQGMLHTCCEACPISLIASGVGLSGGCKAGITLKE